MVDETQVCARCARQLPKTVFRERRLYCDRCYNLAKRYRVTYQEIKALWEKQGCVCALCEMPLELDHTIRNQADAVHVDHCHTTNDIRGLLCRHCNLLLGHAKDRIVVLQAAIRYLGKSKADFPEKDIADETHQDAEEDRQGDG